MKTINIYYFSPTGTTAKCVETMKSSLNDYQVNLIDLSKTSIRKERYLFNSSDLSIIAGPVYAGRLNRIVRYWIQTLNGNGSWVIPVITYGNRHYNDALLEINTLCRKQNFNLLSTAALVCEHSFNLGLAKRRPDPIDRQLIKIFIENSIEKYTSDFSATMNLSSLPGIFPPKTQFRQDFKHPLVPIKKDNCINCQICSTNCPVEAIDSETLIGNNKKCITCYRCIRLCPQNNRFIPGDDFYQHNQWLSKTFKYYKTPEFYY